MRSFCALWHRLKSSLATFNKLSLKPAFLRRRSLYCLVTGVCETLGWKRRGRVLTWMSSSTWVTLSIVAMSSPLNVASSGISAYMMYCSGLFLVVAVAAPISLMNERFDHWRDGDRAALVGRARRQFFVERVGSHAFD